MEDMPGNFLDSRIRLINISGDSTPLEQIAIQNQVILWQMDNKEITNEPDGYSKLIYENLVKKVQEDPSFYIQNIEESVKKSL